jgi:hypothetical protein
MVNSLNYMVMGPSVHNHSTPIKMLQLPMSIVNTGDFG